MTTSDGATTSQPARLAAFQVDEPGDQVAIHRESPVGYDTTRPKVSGDGSRWAQVVYSQEFPDGGSQPAMLRLKALNLATRVAVGVLAEQGRTSLITGCMEEIEQRFQEDSTLQRYSRHSNVEIDGLSVEIPSMSVFGVHIAWRVSMHDGFAVAWPEDGLAPDRRIRTLSVQDL